jgi:hypothetical protein
MPLTKSEASEALNHIATTEDRSSAAYGYDVSAPFLILWGLLWMVGYGGTDLFENHADQIWTGVAIFGFLASMYIGMRRKQATGNPVIALRWTGTYLSLAAFVLATVAVMKPSTGAQVGAFIPLVVAVIYVIAGLWFGFRFCVAGLVIAALTLGGFFYLHEHFALWMAAVGGGGLILGGVWMRTA